MIPTIEELLISGAHFGHRRSRWNPKMQPYIFGISNGVHLINLEKTVECLTKAVNFAKERASNNGVILFVGTKKQASEIIMSEASRSAMPYIHGRWIGGLLTNFETIKKNIDRLDELEIKKEAGDWSKFTKKEQLMLDRERIKLLNSFGGIRSMKKIPDALFVVDVLKEKTAINEAKRLGVPIIAMVDTNTDPTIVKYPIPANDDSIKSIELITKTIADAVLEGYAQ